MGKTSLLNRYVKGTFNAVTTTVGASFFTKRVLDVDSGTIVRLQLWDTAGQERFRAISRLYYRGASAVLLVYSIIDEASFLEMGEWLREMKQNLGDDVVLHVVGTKSDVVARDPGLRKVPFERCIAYVAEHLYPDQLSTPPVTAGSSSALDGHSKRSSGFWGQDIGWDCCHEISASSGEGIDEMFRFITRKLVEVNQKKADLEKTRENAGTPGTDQSLSGYFDGPGSDGRGSFRVGVGDSSKRRSWLGFPTPSIGIGEEEVPEGHGLVKKRKGKCC